MLRYNVFGIIMGIERSGTRWKVYFLSDHGVFRDADFIIPDSVKENELHIYLADLFHESASQENSKVFQLKEHKKF